MDAGDLPLRVVRRLADDGRRERGPPTTQARLSPRTAAKRPPLPLPRAGAVAAQACAAKRSSATMSTSSNRPRRSTSIAKKACEAMELHVLGGLQEMPELQRAPIYGKANGSPAEHGAAARTTRGSGRVREGRGSRRRTTKGSGCTASAGQFSPCADDWWRLGDHAV